MVAQPLSLIGKDIEQKLAKRKVFCHMDSPRPDWHAGLCVVAGAVPVGFDA